MLTTEELNEKTPTNMRLTGRARYIADELASRFGISRTDVIEMLLRQAAAEQNVALPTETGRRPRQKRGAADGN
jgi:hypothetical protein